MLPRSRLRAGALDHARKTRLIVDDGDGVDGIGLPAGPRCHEGDILAANAVEVVGDTHARVHRADLCDKRPGGRFCACFLNADEMGKAGKARMQPFSVLLLECPYPMFERVKLLIEDHEGRIESSDYGAAVTLSFLLPVGKTEAFSAALTELSGGQMSAEEVEQRFLPGARE